MGFFLFFRLWFQVSFSSLKVAIARQ